LERRGVGRARDLVSVLFRLPAARTCRKSKKTYGGSVTRIPSCLRNSFLSSHQISRDVFLATASAWHSYTPRAPTRWRWFPRNGEEDWGRALGSPTTGTDTGTWAAPRLRDPPSPRPTQRRVVRVNACPLSVLTSAPARRFHLQRGCAHRRVGRGRRRLGSRRERPPVALERGGLG
jgi:hypothetical protein